MSAATRPIGYFVHHQGRGHAQRCAAIVNALPSSRPVTIFCARDDIFPPLRAGVDLRRIPSLFEATGTETCQDLTDLPDTLHCAPLGWPGIRQGMGAIAGWFASADPALMICDVSAEIAQLARICSVPHVCVLQHGDRTDPGHQAAYDAAVGLLVPSDVRLAQPDWSPSMLAKSCFSAGVGVRTHTSDRADARADLGLAADAHVVLVLSGGGGSGFASAPIGVGARARPRSQWITVGGIERDWHATEPANLRHDGWVGDTAPYLAAADAVVASTGNTTCHEILAAGLPWLAVPEWRYFDEQSAKAAALQAIGAAHVLDRLPASVQAWRTALEQTVLSHDATLQRSLVQPDAAARAAAWLGALVDDVWPTAPAAVAGRIAAQ